MGSPFYPLVFEPNVHTALWGSEEWLVSGHHTSPSVIANGPWRGRTLEWAASEFGYDFMGKRVPFSDRFPLLFKVIDARDRLSVQVHPSNSSAMRVGGEPKTEMWYVLDHEAPIYAGLRPGVTSADVEDAVLTGRFEDLVVRHAARPGDVLFIPGGLVHAIGAGARVYEVQQSSNTTYRLYDWGRVGADGRPRTLHVAESLMTIDFSLPVPEIGKHADCPFFRFAPRQVSGPCDILSTADTFRVLYLDSGSARLMWEGGEMPFEPGRAILIPANVAARIEPCQAARVLETELGEFREEKSL